jgi:uncharacterized protein (DUF952 family)
VTTGAAESSAPRWLYHAVTREAWERASADGAGSYSARDAHGEGAAFIHASYRDRILESARLYLPAGVARVIVRIDPRRLGALGRVQIAETPRGPMPHIYGTVPRDAIAEVYDEEAFARDVPSAPDAV